MPKFAWIRLIQPGGRSFSPNPRGRRRNFFWHARAADVREIPHTPEVAASPAAEGSPSGALELPERILEFCVAT